MACEGCIRRQRKLVNLACKKPNSWLCRRAKSRLARMESERNRK